MMRARERGMTLIELLVAMAIGVGVVFAISTLLVAGENHKRTTTSTNDADQTGAYAFNAIDKLVRGAGSGFAQSAYSSGPAVLGCKLNAATPVALPRTSAFPAPFQNFLGGAPSNLRVAPVVIGPAQSADGVSDVLMVMSGSGSSGGTSRQITGTSGSSTAVLDNTNGFQTSTASTTPDLVDLVLVSQNGYTDCLLEQVTGITSTNLTLGGAGANYALVNSSELSTFVSSTSTYVTPLGKASVNNVQFMLIGVDTTHTLYSYDLLQNQKAVQGSGPTDAVQSITDQVYAFHAIYGVDTNGDGTQDVWASPSIDPGYDVTTVMTTAAKQQSIVSVRISLLVRGEYFDKNAVSPTSFTLFKGLTNGAAASLAQTVNISSNDQHYRYRLFEFTVPIRNIILLAGGP
jgi:type IV pilus assembly protein PilW